MLPVSVLLKTPVETISRETLRPETEMIQPDGNAPNYREIGQDLIAQQLTSTNIDSFAPIYNDGNAHFQGSIPNTTSDLSSIEPIDGVNSTTGSQENLTENQELNPEINWPFHFEN